MGNTPNIRFKGFTDDWEQRKLGETLKYEQPGAYIVNSTDYDDSYETPVLTAGQSFILGYTNETDGIKNASPDNPVIIFDDFTTSSHFVDFPFKVKSSAMKLLTLKDESDDIYCINNILKNVDYVPASHERHWISIFSEFDVTIPHSKDEQKKIGDYFRNLDNLITLHQRKCDETKKLKKFMLQKMFPKKDEKKPEIRFAGFTDDWEQRKLPEFVTFFNGLTYTPDDVEETGTLVLRSSNVKNGEIVDADNVYVNDKVVTSENVQEGDIIVVVRNGSRALIGKHAQIKDSMPNTVIGAFMSGMRSEHSSFVNALLDTSAFENEIAKNMGATINQITGYMFSRMEFMIPSGEEQQKIGEYFQGLDDLITLHQRKCDEIKEIKKFMLQNMFPQKG